MTLWLIRHLTRTRKSIAPVSLGVSAIKKPLLLILLLNLNVTYADQMLSHKSEIERKTAKEQDDKNFTKVDAVNNYKPKDYEGCPEGKNRGI